MAVCYAGLLSLLGLALVLRHRASGMPDFSVIIYLWVGVLMSGIAAKTGLNLYVGPVLAVLVGFCAGWVHFRGVEQPLERRGDGAVQRTLANIGVQILFAALLWVAGYWFDYYYYPPTSYIFHSMQMYDFQLFGVRGIFYVIPLVCILVYFGFLLSRGAPLRRAMDASRENPELAAVQGVDPWRVKAMIWALSGGLACLAGSLFPPFIHIDPGGNTLLMIPILAVGVVSGFESLPLALVAAWGIGITEILGTLWLQTVYGTWMGEYRPLIPIIILYISMLLLPRGLAELRDPFARMANYLRSDRNRAVKIAAVLLILIGFAALTASTISNNMEEERLGWINIANKIGTAGARIYPDTPTADLPPSLYFDNIVKPKNLISISSVGEFALVIDNMGTKVVYLHDGVLYAIRDASLGYAYDPRNDNFGR